MRTIVAAAKLFPVTMGAVATVALAMVAAPVQADCDPPGSYRLYRSSAVMVGDAPEQNKIHVATFDAAEGEAYNWENCNISAQLRMAQPGVVVRYWCEPATVR